MKIFGLLVILFTFISCGDSPLLNHDVEGINITDDFFRASTEGFKFKKTDYSFNLTWITGPVKGQNKFILKSWHKDLGTLNGPYQDLPNDLYIYLWMPAMGHGSSPVKMKKLNVGEYEVSDAYFIMGGKWEIHFQLLQKETILDEVILPITL
jgi:YtkA-like